MPDWILPSTIAALATVVWWLGKRILSKLDTLESFIQTELRGLDVRLSVVETMLEIKRK